MKHEIKTNTFFANILNENELDNKNFTADIIITDVPYGNLVNWSNTNGEEINRLLDTIIPVINPKTIIAVSHDKNQRIENLKYNTLEKIKTGHRRIEILQLL